MCQLVPGSQSLNKMRQSFSNQVFLKCPARLSHLLIPFCFLLAACTSPQNQFAKVESSKSMQLILDDIEFAITERNFRINNRLHIGKAISERVASGFPDYEVILFCNLSYAQKMLELAPDYISFCPQRIAIRDEGQLRVITASLLPDKSDNPALNLITREINDLALEIIEFAAAEWPLLEE